MVCWKISIKIDEACYVRGDVLLFCTRDKSANTQLSVRPCQHRCLMKLFAVLLTHTDVLMRI